jgi:epidermal growth factor receptor substrate 15
MSNRQLITSSLLTKLFAIQMLALSSSPVWAFSEPLQSLQSLSTPIFNVIVITILALLLGLVISLFVFKQKVRTKKEALLDLAAQNQLAKEKTDRFIGAVLHIDESGNVIYANQMAAYFLVKKIDEMLGKPFVQLCPKSIHGEVNTALEQTREQKIQCLLGKRQRDVKIRIAPQKQPVGDIATFVTIEDVESYQQQIDEQQAIEQHSESALVHANVALARLNFAKQTVSLNPPLCKLLRHNSGDTVSLEIFSTFIEESQRAKWQHTVKQLVEGRSIDLTSQLSIKDRLIPVRIDAHPYIASGQKKPESAILVFDSLLKVEQLKQQSELYQKQLKSVIAASPLPIYFMNADQQIVDCNRPFCAFFKIELNRIRGKRITDIECFDDALKAQHTSANNIGTRRQSIATKVGDQQMEINLYLLSYQNDGKHAGSVAIIEDLTAIKVMEGEVASQTEKMHDLIEHSPLGIAIFDHEDKLTGVNAALTKLLDQDKPVLEKQTFYHLFKNPEQSGTAARLLQQKGHIDNFEAELVCADDNTLTTRIDVSKLAGKEPQYICWVTDSRQQQFLSYQLNQLISYSHMPVGLIGENGFTQLNPAACAFFDAKSEDELIGLSPASETLNADQENADEMAKYLARVQADRKALSVSWTHQLNGKALPCEINLVPLFERDKHISTLCIWVDLRAIEQANAARLEAVNLRQAGEREIAEKQQLLQSSQDLLASRARSLQDSQEKLQTAENDLAAKMDTIVDLQQAHEDISGHLLSLQDDYARNRELLAQSQEANAELEVQLEDSSDKVNRLQKQRNEIADALQYSERKHKKAEEQLALSKQNTQRLKEEQAQQQASLEASLDQIASLKNSIDNKDKQISDVSGQINSLQSQLNGSAQTSEKLRQQLMNQRKASEVAEQKRRELELTCQAAQAELSNKSSYVDNLQHEMNMLEQMSQQQKGDVEKQTQQLEQELKAKQQQLDATEDALSEARKLSEQEKQQSALREAEVAKLQQELQDVEQRSIEQQQKITETDAKWHAQQVALQEELKGKQKELQRTTAQLSNTQQQTEEEKTQHAALLGTLQAELKDVEQRAAAQDEKITQSDQQWQESQQALAEELAAKKAQLDATQEQLSAHQQQVEAEKLARKAQQDKLVQLKQEMANVESRDIKQREMMDGSDEQWRQHHAEIEKQKQQLQESLEQAETQNKAMQSTLTSKLEALHSAESTVSKTQSDEQKLQQQLNAAKEQADALEAKLAQHEEQEKRLKQQVAEQQQSLQKREDNIESLQQEQQRLTEALRCVKEEYAQSKASISDQNTSQQQLSEQLKAFEAELQDSQSQLSNKESALQDAQKQIASSADKLAAQEQALIDAQKEELKQVNEQQPSVKQEPVPEFARLPIPTDPTVWFDLLPYLQHRQSVTSLASTLQTLMDEMQQKIEALDTAVNGNNSRDIQLSARKLISVLEGIPSAPLSDMANRLQSSCDNRMIDNIAIFWPTAKHNLLLTLRVIYSHLHAENS